MGRGIQVRCAPAAAREKGPSHDPMGLPARAAALLSFVPPQRRGLPWVWFPAQDGIDSRSPRGKGRGRGWSGNQIRNGSPAGCWGRKEGSGGGDYRHTTFCVRAEWGSGACL